MKSATSFCTTLKQGEGNMVIIRIPFDTQAPWLLIADDRERGCMSAAISYYQHHRYLSYSTIPQDLLHLSKTIKRKRFLTEREHGELSMAYNTYLYSGRYLIFDGSELKRV